MVLSPLNLPEEQDSVLDLDEKDHLFRKISSISNFIRGFNHELRFGELSRAPLCMLRFQITAEIAECDWMARMPDPWDSDLPRRVQLEHQSRQALRDAMDIRALLFEALPHLKSAQLCAYRVSDSFTPEMILSGSVSRNDQTVRNLHSLVMRARGLGFRFRIEDEQFEKSKKTGRPWPALTSFAHGHSPVQQDKVDFDLASLHPFLRSALRSERINLRALRARTPRATINRQRKNPLCCTPLSAHPFPAIRYFLQSRCCCSAKHHAYSTLPGDEETIEA